MKTLLKFSLIISNIENNNFFSIFSFVGDCYCNCLINLLDTCTNTFIVAIFFILQESVLIDLCLNLAFSHFDFWTFSRLTIKPNPTKKSLSEE